MVNKLELPMFYGVKQPGSGRMIKAPPLKEEQALASAPVQKFYSASTCGFYSTDVHDVMPKDAVEITQQEWRALLDAEASGKVLRSDPSGRPYADDKNHEERAVAILSHRDNLLAQTDWLVARHRDEIEVGIATLPADHYRALQNYRKALRALPSAAGFPDTPLPPKPEWLELK